MLVGCFSLLATLAYGQDETDPLFIPPSDTLNISAFIVANDPEIGSLADINTNGAVDVQDVNDAGWVFGAYAAPGGEKVFLITMDSLLRPDKLLTAGPFGNVIPIEMSGSRIAYNRDFGGSVAGFYRDYDESTGELGPERLAGRYADFTTVTGIGGDYAGSNSFIYDDRPDYNSLSSLVPLFTFNIPILGPVNLFPYVIPENYNRGIIKNLETGQSKPLAFQLAQYFNRYSEVNDVNASGTAVGASRGRQNGDIETLYPFIYNFREDLGRNSIGYILNGESGYATGVNAYDEVVGIYQPPGNPYEQAFYIGVGCQDPVTLDYDFDIILPNRFITTPDLNINGMVVGTFLTNEDGATDGFENRTYIYQHCDCGEGDFFNLNEMFHLQYPNAPWTLRVGRGINDRNYAVGRGVDQEGNWIAWRVKIPNCFFCTADEELTWYQLKPFDIGNKAFNNSDATQEIRILNVTDPSVSPVVFTGNALDSLITANQYYFVSPDQYQIEIDFDCGNSDKTRLITVDVFKSHIPRPTPDNIRAYQNLPAKSKGEFTIPGEDDLEAPRFFCPEEGYDLLVIQQERAFSNFMVQLEEDSSETVLPFYRDNDYPLADGDPALFSDLIVKEIELYNQANPELAIKYQVLTDVSLMDEPNFFTWLEQYSAVWVNFEGFNEYGFQKFNEHADEWTTFAVTNIVVGTAGQMFHNYGSLGFAIDTDFFLPAEVVKERQIDKLYDMVIDPSIPLMQSVDAHATTTGEKKYVFPWLEYMKEREASDMISLREANDTLASEVEYFYEYLEVDPPVDKSNFFELFRSSTLFMDGLGSYKVQKYGLAASAGLSEPFDFRTNQQYIAEDIQLGFIPQPTYAYFEGGDGETITALNGLLWGTANNLLYHKTPTYDHARMLANTVNRLAHMVDTNFIIAPVRQFVFHAKEKPCFKTSLDAEEESAVNWFYKNAFMADFEPIDPATFTFDPDVDWGLVQFVATHGSKSDTIWGNVANWGLYTLTEDGTRHLFDSDRPFAEQPGINLETGKVAVIVHGWQPQAVHKRNSTIAQADEDMQRATTTAKSPLVNQWIEEGYTIIELNWVQIADRFFVQDVEEELWRSQSGPGDPPVFTQRWRHEVKGLPRDRAWANKGLWADEVSLEVRPQDFFAAELKAFLEAQFVGESLQEFRMVGHSLGAGVSVAIMSRLLTSSNPPMIGSEFNTPMLQSDCVDKRIEWADAYWSVEYTSAVEGHVINLVDNWNVPIVNYNTTAAADISQLIGSACQIITGESNFGECAVTLLTDLVASITTDLAVERIAALISKKIPIVGQVLLAIEVIEYIDRVVRVINYAISSAAILERITEVRLDLNWTDNLFIVFPNVFDLHGAAWVHILYNLKSQEPEIYKIENVPDTPETEYRGYNPMTCTELLRRYKNVYTVMFEGKDTRTTQDDQVRFASVMDEERFMEQWQGFVCTFEEVPRVALDDIVEFPTAELPVINGNDGFAFDINEAEYDAGAVIISYGRRDKQDDSKINWYPVINKDKFWFDYTYFEGWELDKPDSLYLPYGKWLIRAEFECANQGIVGEQIFTTEALDWGIYFKNEEGKLKKHIKNEDNPYFNPTGNTVIYSHGYQGGSVEKRYLDDLNWEGLNLTNNFHALDWNVGVFNWTQFADAASVPEAQDKIHTSYSAGMPYRTWDSNEIKTEGSVTGRAVADLFAKSVDDAMGSWDFNEQELRLVGHSLGSQVVTNGAFEMSIEKPNRIALLDAFWTTSRLNDMITYVDELSGFTDLQENEYDFENKSYSGFEWIAATNFDQLGEVDVPGIGKQFENIPIKQRLSFLRIAPDFLVSEFGFTGIGLPFADFLGANYLINPASSHYAPVVWYFNSFGQQIPTEYFHDEQIANSIGYENLIGTDGSDPDVMIELYNGKYYEKNPDVAVSANQCTHLINNRAGIETVQIEGKATLTPTDDIHEILLFDITDTDWEVLIREN